MPSNNFSIIFISSLLSLNKTVFNYGIHNYDISLMEICLKLFKKYIQFYSCLLTEICSNHQTKLSIHIILKYRSLFDMYHISTTIKFLTFLLLSSHAHIVICVHANIIILEWRINEIKNSSSLNLCQGLRMEHRRSFN